MYIHPVKERIRNESLWENESGTPRFSLIFVKTFFQLSCKSLILNKYFFLYFTLPNAISNHQNKTGEKTNQNSNSKYYQSIRLKMTIADIVRIKHVGTIITITETINVYGTKSLSELTYSHPLKR